MFSRRASAAAQRKPARAAEVPGHQPRWPTGTWHTYSKSAAAWRSGSW